MSTISITTPHSDGTTSVGTLTANGAVVFGHCLERTRWPSGATLVSCTNPAGHEGVHRHAMYTWRTDAAFAS